ncbi:MAG TPA: hypothetical protein VFC78_13880 [Tepidisphaeraceae bacterium]|nr:hypothetical protein [Tepidisphaeraceae bacterium]
MTPSAQRSATIFASQLRADGSHIEVVRGDYLSLQACRSAVAPNSFQGATAIYPVSLQIRPPKGPPIILWRRIKSEYNDPISDGIAVLDMAVEPERIILVTAEDTNISVWFFGFYFGDSPRAVLSAADWGGASGAFHVGRDNVQAKIGRTTDGLRLTLTVMERGKSTNRRTVYEQVSDDAWPMAPKFRIVSQTPPLEVSHPNDAK